MANWTLAEIGRCLGGPALTPERGATQVSSISTDTRTLTQGSVFVPLVGERFDGHNFVAKALEAGCAGVVWARPEVPPELESITVFPVEDTLEAYQALGRHWKELCGVRCLGITGSIGKTTTKEMLAHLIGDSLVVHKNRKNYNNDIGVPLTLLELEPRHDLVIVEMGMRGLGQIARLVRCACPEVGIITAIGTSHLELLGSREAIARAKAELFEGLPSEGWAVSPQDDDFASLLKESSSGQVLSYSGKPDSAAQIKPDSIVASDAEGTTFIFAGGEHRLPLPGPHHLHDLFAVLAAGQALGLEWDQMLARLPSMSNPEGRAEWATIRQARFYLDCYNSAPESLRAALGVLSSCSGRRLAVLGDMLELGEGGVAAHQAIGRELADFGVDQAFCVGPLSQHLAEQAGERGRWFESKEALTEALLEELLPGDSVLVKASRGLALETIVETVKEKEAI